MPSTTANAWYNGNTLNTSNTLSGFGSGDGGSGGFGYSSILDDLFRRKREYDDYNWMKERVRARDAFARDQKAADLTAKRQLDMMRATRDPLADKKNRFAFERDQQLERERREPIPLTGYTAPNAAGVWYRADYTKMNPTQRAMYNPSGSTFAERMPEVPSDSRAGLTPAEQKKEVSPAELQLQFMRNLFAQNPTAYGIHRTGREE